MLLSVLVFEHELTKGQWIGVGCVFTAVAMEALVGIREKKGKAKVDGKGMNGKEVIRENGNGNKKEL